MFKSAVKFAKHSTRFAFFLSDLLFQQKYIVLITTHTRPSPPSISSLSILIGVNSWSYCRTKFNSQAPTSLVSRQKKKMCARSATGSPAQEWRQAGELFGNISASLPSLGRSPCTSLQAKEVASLLRAASLTLAHTSPQSVVGLATSALHGLSCGGWSGSHTWVTSRSRRKLYHCFVSMVVSSIPEFLAAAMRVKKSLL